MMMMRVNTTMMMRRQQKMAIGKSGMQKEGTTMAMRQHVASDSYNWQAKGFPP